uniref:Tetraspanin n=1 Tax=Macrostomum lignano TaxID=282301 RepID=A0A1I8FIZ2_9PLAT
MRPSEVQPSCWKPPATAVLLRHGESRGDRVLCDPVSPAGVRPLAHLDAARLRDQRDLVAHVDLPTGDFASRIASTTVSMGCSTSLAKMILFIFNVAFFIFGIASLGLGIWWPSTRTTCSGSSTWWTHRSPREPIKPIKSGAVTRGWLRSDWPGTVHCLLVGFCGCCGAMKESKCLLMIYAGLVGLVLVLEITAAIMAAVFQSHVRNSAEAGAMLRVQNRFFVAMPDYAADAGDQRSNAAALRTIGDIANSSSWTASNRTFAGKELKVPLTLLPPARKPEKTMTPGCPYKPLGGNGGLNNALAYNSLLEYVSQYSKPIIIICVAIGLFEILAFCSHAGLIRAIENDVSYAKQ